VAVSLEEINVNAKPTTRLLFGCCVISVALAQAACATNLLMNPGFESGNPRGWTCSDANLAVVAGSASDGSVHGGSSCAYVSNRTQASQGPVQSVLGVLKLGSTYRFSAWVRLENGISDQAGITVAQTDSAGPHHFNLVSATVYSDSWTCLSGTFAFGAQGAVTALDVYVEGPKPGVNFYVDDANAEQVGDWHTLVQGLTEQYRKRQETLMVLSPTGEPVSGATVDVNQVKHDFAFGSAINTNVLSSSSYAKFFREHFEWAVCENESKWYSNEATQGHVTYSNADKIYTWCNQNGITMRGHCLYWDATNTVQSWLKALGTEDLLAAVHSRMESAVPHFKGKFMHWDINNEMVPNHYYEDRLGNEIRVWMFQRAHELDPNCLLFVNEYNVVDGGSNYNGCVQLVQWLLANNAPVQAIGTQSHVGSGFNRLDIISRFNGLAAFGLPIWCTEFDVDEKDVSKRATELEDFYRIAFSQPAVKGIMMWGFWQSSMWRSNAWIVDTNWTVNAAGRKYEDLIKEWTTNTEGTTDANGVMTFRGFHGAYQITITPPNDAPVKVSVDLPPGDLAASCVIQLNASGGATLRENQ
jgi:endo-1,4-beta-xylanase